MNKEKELGRLTGALLKRQGCRPACTGRRTAAAVRHLHLQTVTHVAGRQRCLAQERTQETVATCCAMWQAYKWRGKPGILEKNHPDSQMGREK